MAASAVSIRAPTWAEPCAGAEAEGVAEDTAGGAVTTRPVTAVRPAERSAVTSAAGLADTALSEAVSAVEVAASAAATSKPTSTPASSR